VKQAVCVIIPRWPEKSAGHDVLVVSRRNKPDMWGLPGGKVDPGETSSEAAVRELLEETGIRVYENELVPIFTALCPGTVPYWVTTYLATARLPNIEHLIVPEEGLKVDWMPLTVITDPDFCPFARYNIGVLEALQHYRGEATWAHG
jgi:8-oxo-dGTP pyrophosphatase MutT (NUDIX family)